MVKGYDPTTSDPSKLLLQYLLRWSTTPNPIPLQMAEKYTKYWLKNSSSTSQIYSKFIHSQATKQPQIILKKNCHKILGWSYWKGFLGKQNHIDENYPAYIQDNKIVVCLNFITNKTELKENIDRQLTILLKSTQQIEHQEQNSRRQLSNFKEKGNTNSIQQIDKQLIQRLYDGCKQGYKNYMLESEVQERMSRKCAKYLFFRRSRRELPLDAKFRYASKIIEEVV